MTLIGALFKNLTCNFCILGCRLCHRVVPVSLLADFVERVVKHLMTFNDPPGKEAGWP